MFIKLKILIGGSPNSNIKYLTEDFSWVKGVEITLILPIITCLFKFKDTKKLDTRPDDITVRKVRYVISQVPLKYCVFIFESKVEIKVIFVFHIVL